MNFTDELRKKADDIFNAIFNCPFVQGIAEGKLKKEQLIHYLKQDHEYLTAYMRIYGIAISKCDDRADIKMFNDQISFILNTEINPHLNFCAVAGVNYEDMSGHSLSPSANHYVSYMLSVAHVGSLGEIMAVLLPCPLTYLEIAMKITQEVKPDKHHPFYDWINFYATNTTTTQIFINKLNERAKNANEDDRRKMTKHYLLSCELELMFWNMAYEEEDWATKIMIR